MVSIIYIVVGLLGLFVVQKLAAHIRLARLRRKHGCKLENRITQVERIIGLDIYFKQMAGHREHRLLDIAISRYREFGNTWSAKMIGGKYYNTIEPENVKTILATNFKDYGLGRREEFWKPLLGSGIFTSDGQRWEHSRALVRPNFTRAQVADLDTFEPHIQEMIALIPRDGSTIDLQPLFFSLTLDSATEFLFGESVNSLRSTKGSEQDEFGKAFDLGQNRLSRRSRLGKLVYLFPEKEFDAACQTVHHFVDKIILKALDKSNPKDVEKSIGGDGHPERYVFLTELLKSTRDPVQLRSELLNILLAGRDTTASLLSSTFHVLARRPDIWKKLKAEVDELDGAKPDYETLRNMKYIKYLLNETLRLYPVVPVNARFAVNDTVLPRGGGPDGQSPLLIPRGSVAVYSINTMHRRKDIYGADAEEFRPERWVPEEGLRPGWGYLPFNGGPRICVGQQFALTEASYTIVRLVQEFGAIEDRDGTPWQEKLNLTMCSGKGVQVAMVPR